MMPIASRTPEGFPHRCPVCRKKVRIDPSIPPGDAPCPACGCLLWFSPADLMRQPLKSVKERTIELQRQRHADEIAAWKRERRQQKAAGFLALSALVLMTAAVTELCGLPRDDSELIGGIGLVMMLGAVIATITTGMWANPEPKTSPSDSWLFLRCLWAIWRPRWLRRSSRQEW